MRKLPPVTRRSFTRSILAAGAAPAIIPGRKSMAEQSVRLRLIVTADSWTAQFQPGGGPSHHRAPKWSLGLLVFPFHIGTHSLPLTEG